MEFLLTPLVFIKDTVVALFNFLKDILVNIFNFLKDVLVNIFNFIIKIPELILDGLKNLFIPNQETLTAKLTAIRDTFSSKFPNANLNILNRAVDSSSANTFVVNNTKYVTIMGKTYEVEIMSVFYRFWNTYKDIFQGWISGFMYLLLAIFNYRQVLYLIRGSSPIESTPPPSNNKIGFKV